MKPARPSKVAALQDQLAQARRRIQELEAKPGTVCTCGHGKSEHGQDGIPCNSLFCMCEKFTPR